jgi:ATP-dependent DNA helicase RecG
VTAEQLRALIAGGETLDVEFKGEERERLSDSDLIDAVVCMSNRSGSELGWILVGVEDDGRVTGARPRHEAGATDVLRVQALIANRTRPSVAASASLQALGSRTVLVVEVPVSTVPVATSGSNYVRRVLGGAGKPECVPYFYNEMVARQADLGHLDYTGLVVPGATWRDLDPLEFERFRRSIRESVGRGDKSLVDLPDQELAKALGAVESNHAVRAVRMLGLLLFGKEDALRRFVPGQEVAFQQLDGTDVQVNDFFRWPLMRVMDELLSRFRARHREEELMVGMLRIGVPDYSEDALREGVANALIHRDYTRLGAVHVQWHNDRIEISNPGGFPEGVRLDNILVTPPKPRNPLLADAFKRAGIVERTARGVDRIFYEQLRNGRPAPSYARTTSADVVLVLPGGKANLEFVRLVSEEGRERRPLTLDELLLLNVLQRERRLCTADAARLIQKPEDDARSALEALVESGLVEATGEGRGRAYHLSAAVYRRLGRVSAYVRTRGFEPLQQEQMVMNYVDTKGGVSRAGVMELCHLTGPQAYRLLRRLVAKGLLVPVLKRGRGAGYARKAR